MADDTLTRQIYGRLFKGAFQDIAYTVPQKLIGTLFDATYMPSLLLDKGKSGYLDFQLAQNTSTVIPLPPAYTTASKLYIAIQTDLRATVTIVSPTHGSAKKTLLYGTDTDTAGTHATFFTYQGDVTSLTISIPSTANGGATTCIKVFMYEIPDLEDFESYFDKQIGLGSSGDS